MSRRALITGITGQDGSYLAEFLLGLGYEVWGLARHSSAGAVPKNLTGVIGQIHLVSGDVTDRSSVEAAFSASKPDEVYNLAAQSFVPLSWAEPWHTFEVNVGGLINVLEVSGGQLPRVYQASSSEMYGGANGPQDEYSPMLPVSPYGASKLAAHRLAQAYRRARGQFICCGILFNHESPRRHEDFVSQKIVKGMVEIALGVGEELVLGNVTTQRDWGFAGDYVQAIWAMMQTPEPMDLVVGTGVSRPVSDWIEFTAWALAGVGLGPPDGDWSSRIHTGVGQQRLNDIACLRADYSKAAEHIGWRPSTDFRSMVRLMVAAELGAAKLRKLGG